VADGGFSCRFDAWLSRYQWNGQKIQAADHAETIHEGQKQALAKQLFIDNTGRGGTGVSAAIAEQLDAY
jgi:hypothetical protein